MRRNVELNNLDNVTVIECALGDQEGTANLSLYERGLKGGHSLVFEHEGKVISVQVKTGDGLIGQGQAPRPNVIKIDVEGAEIAVLHGMHNLLGTADLKVILCEVNSAGSPVSQPREVVNKKLSDAGFDDIRWTQRGGEAHAFARKKDSS